jgi:hypothetical protein
MSMNRDTIDVHLAYGSSGMTVRLPAAATTVITPRPRAAAQDERATLREAIESPVAGCDYVSLPGPANGWRSRCATSPGRSRAR